MMKKGHKVDRPMRRKGENAWAFIGRMTTPEPNSGCLLWLGATNGDGYGNIQLNGRVHKAHRVAFAEKVGPIPPGVHVLHRCDVPSCVNPAHLFLGTHAENMVDKVKKGRLKRMRGEKNGRAKLCSADIVAIRALRGEMAHEKIAHLFGVSRQLIGRIQSGKRWTHEDCKVPA